jgi:hypothetical protein
MVPQGQPGQKVPETISQQDKDGCGGGMLSSQLREEVYDRRIATQAALGKKQRCITRQPKQ